MAERNKAQVQIAKANEKSNSARKTWKYVTSSCITSCMCKRFTIWNILKPVK